MNCLHCRTKFTPRRSTAVFCSTRCRVAYHRTGEERPRPEKLYSITGLTKDQHKWLMGALKNHASHVAFKKAKAEREERLKADEAMRKNAKHSDFVARFGAAYSFMVDDHGNVKPGNYWTVWCGKAVVVEVVKGPRGGVYAVLDGKKYKPEFHWIFGWSVGVYSLSATERECLDKISGIGATGMTHMSDADLKRMRSQNHPDRNANADVTAYQAACAELNRRR